MYVRLWPTVLSLCHVAVAGIVLILLTVPTEIRRNEPSTNSSSIRVDGSHHFCRTPAARAVAVNVDEIQQALGNVSVDERLNPKIRRYGECRAKLTKVGADVDLCLCDLPASRGALRRFEVICAGIATTFGLLTFFAEDAGHVVRYILTFDCLSLIVYIVLMTLSTVEWINDNDAAYDAYFNPNPPIHWFVADQLLGYGLCVACLTIGCCIRCQNDGAGVGGEEKETTTAAAAMAFSLIEAEAVEIEQYQRRRSRREDGEKVDERKTRSSKSVGEEKSWCKKIQTPPKKLPEILLDVDDFLEVRQLIKRKPKHRDFVKTWP